jgi:ribosome-binding protein aMBF1 (putative translation factor)
MNPNPKTLRDVATILARARHNPGITDEQLARQVLETAALTQAKAPAKTKPASEG